MAHSPKSFKLDTKKKQIILYTNIRIEAEVDLINYYLSQGYEPKYDVKKPPLKVEDMRKAMKDDAEALAEFNRIYAIKVDKDASQEEKKNSGFFGACKFYTKWAKENKKK